MIWIVSGPGSVGKTTFLQSPRCHDLTGLPPDTPVIWPNQVGDELRRQRATPRDVYLHYSLFQRFRVYQQWVRQAAKSGPPTSAPIRFPAVDDDPRWSRFTKAPVPKQAVVLVASKATLLARMQERTISEPAVFRQRDERVYNRERLMARVAQTDLLQFYRDWLASLDRHRVPYLLIGSEDERYPVLTPAELSERVCGGWHDHTWSTQPRTERADLPGAYASGAGSFCWWSP